MGRTAGLNPILAVGAHFNSLAPCGANRDKTSVPDLAKRFQLTRPVWGEPSISSILARKSLISTHSPRVGRTHTIRSDIAYATHFNSLAPCGANPRRHTARPYAYSFQLTRPVWGEPCRLHNHSLGHHISTHSPRVGRTATQGRFRTSCRISTHSPRVGRTSNPSLDTDIIIISTHSPRVGRTAGQRLSAPPYGNFNSLAPCGANHRRAEIRHTAVHFNSLAPCGANLTLWLTEHYNRKFQLTRPVWGEPESAQV